MSEKFDLDHLHLAKFWAERRSKDPSTKVGAVLVRPNGSVASLSYNGFPRKMDDSPELYLDREAKLSRIIHAEINAVMVSEDRSLEGYTIYVWPFMPCERCAVHIIQAGIKRVVSVNSELESKWADSILKGIQYFNEANVEHSVYTQEEFIKDSGNE